MAKGRKTSSSGIGPTTMAVTASAAKPKSGAAATKQTDKRDVPDKALPVGGLNDSAPEDCRYTATPNDVDVQTPAGGEGDAVPGKDSSKKCKPGELCLRLAHDEKEDQLVNTCIDCGAFCTDSRNELREGVDARGLEVAQPRTPSKVLENQVGSTVNESQGRTDGLHEECDKYKALHAEALAERDQAILEQQSLNAQLESASQEMDVIQAKCDEYKALSVKATDERDQVDKVLQSLNASLQRARQETDRIQAECDKYKAIVTDRDMANLLDGAGVQNLLAKYLNLKEIQTEIKQTLTVWVSEWVESMCTQLEPHAFIIPQLLARIFSESQAVVERRRQEVHAFFLCGSDIPTTTAVNMDQDTAKFMLKHMRLYFKDIFPLSGDYIEKACDGIVTRLAAWTSDNFKGFVPGQAAELLGGASLRNIITRYLYVLVCATLHNPRAEFGDDCGQEQFFDPAIHAPSIDGDALFPGDKCVVVFPAMKAEPSCKGYILRAVEPRDVNTSSHLNTAHQVDQESAEGDPGMGAGPAVEHVPGNMIEEAG